MKLAYPACFYSEKKGGYSVVVPDLLGCCSQGETLEEALETVQDAALGWLLTAAEENEEFPKSTEIKNIQLENKAGAVAMLLLDLGAYSQKYGKKNTVKKTLSIPAWLNEKAERQKINFSQTLQEALLYKITHKK